MRQSTQIKYLFREEVDKLLNSITSPRDKAMFTLMYYRGLRASEVGMLNIEHYRPRDNKLYVSRLKGSISGEHKLLAKERRVLNKWLEIRAMTKYAKCGKVLFPVSLKSDRRITRQWVGKLFRHYAEKIGLPADKCHPHVLKHSIATHLGEKGENVQDIQDWLGHKDVRNTMKYLEVTSKARDDMASRMEGAGL